MSTSSAGWHLISWEGCHATTSAPPHWRPARMALRRERPVAVPHAPVAVDQCLRTTTKRAPRVRYGGPMRLPDLVTRLFARPGPALTWYGADGARTELGGPVVARWLAKTANLLGTELAGSLFGEFPSPSGAACEDAEGSPAGIIRVDLGCSWQSLVWTVAAWLSGWTVVGPASISAPGDSLRDEGDATVWVVASLDAAAVEAAETGVWVLAHDLAPLALGWSGEPLPDLSSDRCC